MAASAHRCCDEMRLSTVGDCGSVTGFDLTLQRCRSCGGYVMDFFWAGSSTSNPLPPSVARPLGVVRDGVAAALATLDEGDEGSDADDPAGRAGDPSATDLG